MSVYRSALGRQVDMTALSTKYEKTRAVGNMGVNARGDTIDAEGKIVTPVTEKVNQAYAKTVGNKSAQTGKRATEMLKPAPAKKTQEQEEKLELTELERDLEDNLEEDLKVEKIKEQEVKKLGGNSDLYHKTK